MAEQGDGIHLVVLSRSRSFSNLKTAQDLAAEVKQLGATLHLISCDVSKEDEVESAVKLCQKSLPPIRGVIQGAMVLRVSTFLLEKYEIAYTSLLTIDRIVHSRL
jgi:NAD(P)-dependent dehydrogenase (short-subunit alcohol dehydrogenase family)